jgi:hypothetical protein
MKKRTFTLSVSFFILHVSAIIALAASVPLQTGQTTCYKPDGGTYPCAGTGQDGDLKPGVPWPAPRFTDNTDGTITDNLTGLIWMQNMQTAGPTEGFPGLNCTKSGIKVNWQEALDHVKCLNTFSYLGFTDWRLPTAAELASVVNYGVSDQYSWLSSSGFIFSSQYYYWSSTSRADASSQAFSMERLSGKIKALNKSWDANYDIHQGYTIFAWPIRGNQ